MIWTLFKILEIFEILSVCYFVMYYGSNTSKFRNNLNEQTENLFKDTFSKQQTNKIVHVHDKRIDLK